MEIPALQKEDIFFELKDSSMGTFRKMKVEVVVQIDPIGYYECPYKLKPQAAEDLYYWNDVKSGRTLCGRWREI